MTLSENARAHMAHGASLVAVSSAYPSQIVSDRDFLERAAFEPSDGWARISAESGIRLRRWCSPQENSATLMSAAIARLMAEHPGAISEVDAVVVASGTTMPVVLPISEENPAAADLAPLALRQLGVNQGLGLDVKACYCTGFLRGLEVADALLASPNRRSVLVVAVEQGSKLATAASNRSSFCFMVGDAAGAAILAKGPKHGGGGLLDHGGYTDHHRLEWVGIGPDARSIIMMGNQAAEASVELFVDIGRTLLRRNRKTPRDIEWLLPLQTHEGLVARIAERLEWPRERVLWDAAELGFSGSASIPACLADKLRAGVVAPGDLVLALAVGAGLNCAGALFRC